MNLISIHIVGEKFQAKMAKNVSLLGGTQEKLKHEGFFKKQPKLLLACLKILAHTSSSEPVFSMAAGHLEVIIGWRAHGAREVMRATQGLVCPVSADGQARLHISTGWFSKSVTLRSTVQSVLIPAVISDIHRPVGSVSS